MLWFARFNTLWQESAASSLSYDFHCEKDRSIEDWNLLARFSTFGQESATFLGPMLSIIKQDEVIEDWNLLVQSTSTLWKKVQPAPSPMVPIMRRTKLSRILEWLAALQYEFE